MSILNLLPKSVFFFCCFLISFCLFVQTKDRYFRSAERFRSILRGRNISNKKPFGVADVDIVPFPNRHCMSVCMFVYLSFIIESGQVWRVAGSVTLPSCPVSPQDLVPDHSSHVTLWSPICVGLIDQALECRYIWIYTDTLLHGYMINTVPCSRTQTHRHKQDRMAFSGIWIKSTPQDQKKLVDFKQELTLTISKIYRTAKQVDLKNFS